MPKNLKQCKTGKDFITYGEKHGGYVDRQTGSHAIMKAPGGGTCPVPMHNRELATGTRIAIQKQFIAIGLGILILSMLLWMIL